MAESTRGDLNIDPIGTPTPTKTLSQLNDFAFPFTPQPVNRRSTYVVEDGNNANAEGQTSVTGTITVFEVEEMEDERIRDDLDEAMAELENLENLVLGFVNSLA